MSGGNSLTPSELHLPRNFTRSRAEKVRPKSPPPRPAEYDFSRVFPVARLDDAFARETRYSPGGGGTCIRRDVLARAPGLLRALAHVIRAGPVATLSRNWKNGGGVRACAESLSWCFAQGSVYAQTSSSTHVIHCGDRAHTRPYFRKQIRFTAEMASEREFRLARLTCLMCRPRAAEALSARALIKLASAIKHSSALTLCMRVPPSSLYSTLLRALSFSLLL